MHIPFALNKGVNQLLSSGVPCDFISSHSVLIPSYQQCNIANNVPDLTVHYEILLLVALQIPLLTRNIRYISVILSIRRVDF